MHNQADEQTKNCNKDAGDEHFITFNQHRFGIKINRKPAENMIDL